MTSLSEGAKKQLMKNVNAKRCSHSIDLEIIARTMEDFIYQFEASNSYNHELSVSIYKNFIYQINDQIQKMLPQDHEEKYKYDPNELPF